MTDKASNHLDNTPVHSATPESETALDTRATVKTLVDADTDSMEALAEDLLAHYQAQYEALPPGNILAEGHNWEAVVARLNDPENAPKLGKILELQGCGRLYAVMEDGSLEFMDADPTDPPRFFIKFKEGNHLQRFSPDKLQGMTVENSRFAKCYELLRWAEENGFGVFEADDTGERRFSQLMKLAEAASPTECFVGTSDVHSQIGSALKGGRYIMKTAGYCYAHLSRAHPSYFSPVLGILRRVKL